MFGSCHILPLTFFVGGVTPLTPRGWFHLFERRNISLIPGENFRCFSSTGKKRGIFLFLLNRDTINIPDLIPGKSISHSQTIQAAQGILCPCRAAAKGCLKPAGFHSSSHTWVLSTAPWIWRPDIPILVATCSPLSDSGINHQSRGERGLFKIRLGIPDPVLSLLRHSPHLLVLPSCVNPGKLQGTLKDNSSSGNEIEQHPKGEI